MCQIVIEYQLCPCADYTICTLLDSEGSVRYGNNEYHVISEQRLPRAEAPCKREIVRRTGSPDKGYLVTSANLDCPEATVGFECTLLGMVCATCSTTCNGDGGGGKTDEERVLDWWMSDGAS